MLVCVGNVAHRRVRIVLTPDETPVLQIVEQIERLVALGVHQPGDELPGAGTLADELGISRVTVQKAYGLLIERKVAESRVGSGTFIAEYADTRPDFMRRLFSMAITLGQNLYLSETEISQAFESEIRRHFPQRDDEVFDKRRESPKEERPLRGRAAT